MEKQKNIQEDTTFRGIVIPIKKDGSFGVKISGGVNTLEMYGALTILLKQLESDLSK